MNKRFLYVAVFLLAAFAVVFSACKQPTGGSRGGSYTYTVTFDKNHGDADGWTEADPQTVKVTSPKTKVGSLPAEPERTGWKFTGWNTDRNGNGTLFTKDTTVKKSVTVYAQWKEKDSSGFAVEINIDGDIEGDDSVALSSNTGQAGETVTITYTVADSQKNNRLVFSGTKQAIDPVNSAGNGSRTYVINEDDSADGRISINALFTHSDKEIDEIAFADTQNVGKIYGDSPFTKAITKTGAGSGAISYSSGTPDVATVNSATGQVTIISTGDSVITATKAEDATYAAARAMYTLTVSARQLTISVPNVTVTKKYDGTTDAAMVIGTPANVVSGDTVNVTAVASYNSANVSEANLITVVYTITGSSASNYTKPADYTIDGSISKADGVTLASAPTASSVTSSSITVRAINPPAGLTVEYAVSTAATPTPASGWQTGTSFTGLEKETDYYIHARVQGNENCNTGPAAVSAKITTPAPVVIPRTTIVDFEADSIGKKYEFTKGDNDPTRVEVTADPARTGEKSLRITTNGSPAWNQAAIIPINLPYALSNYNTFSFRFYLASGTSSEARQIMVYAAGGTGTFVRYGFGNSSGDHHFTANLVGQTANISFTTTGNWIDYTITINNPGAAISNLKGDIFIAVGINNNTALDYYVDDLTFTLKDNFVPPLPKPAPQPPSVGAVSSGNYRNMFEEMGKTEAAITAKVQETWNKIFTGDETYRFYYPVGSDMAYILDSGNNDVRSEGMSYGMMMAVQMNQKDVFDRLWKWAKTYMYNETNRGKNSRGYFAWQCNTNGTTIDVGCAPDGEFYFATALLFASARWGNGTGVLNYRQHAMQLLYDMIHRDSAKGDNYGEPSMFRTTHHNGYGQYMTTFQPQGSAGQFTDPSYHLPAFYEVWAIEMERDADAGNTWGIWTNVQALRDDAAFYRNAVQASRSFFPKTTNATTGLGPDYANFDGTPTGGNHAHFEYDAFRIAMNIAVDYAWWAADSWQKTFADRIQAFFFSKGVNSYTALWQLDGTPRQDPGDHSPGLVACNAAASLSATHERAWEFLDDFWNAGMTPGKYRYYDGCLYMLGLLHVTGNFKAYLSGGTVITPNSSSISPETATFDKKAGAQADINVTMTLNGNTFVRIQNGATTLSGTDYTRSGDTVTLKKEYFAAQPVGTTTLTFVFSAGSNRTLTVTVEDTTPSTTISPTTATFDKKTDLQADITVTMTLYGGNTFDRIQNGGTTLTSGTHYTVSGNTVILKSSYLAAQPVGTTTLTFYFSGGVTRTIVITIKETTGGGGGTAGTKYDFSTNPGEVWSFGPAGTGASASWNATDGALTVTVGSSRGNNNNNSETLILPFNLGDDSLADYKTISVTLRSTNNATYKNFRVEVVSSNDPTAFGFSGQNTQLAGLGSNSLGNNGTWVERNNITISTSSFTSLKGIVYIGFGVPEVIANGATYQIKSIELKK